MKIVTYILSAFVGAAVAYVVTGQVDIALLGTAFGVVSCWVIGLFDQDPKGPGPTNTSNGTGTFLGTWRDPGP